MRPYQVTGAAVQISPGAVLIMSVAQVAARKHQVKELKKIGKDGIQVEALALLTFKVGEVIGLDGVPKQAIGHLIDLIAADEAKREAGYQAAQGDRDAARAAKAAADHAARDAADAAARAVTEQAARDAADAASKAAAEQAAKDAVDAAAKAAADQTSKKAK